MKGHHMRVQKYCKNCLAHLVRLLREQHSHWAVILVEVIIAVWIAISVMAFVIGLLKK